MHLEVVHPHFRSRRVKLSRAILTLDPWIVHELDIVRTRGVRTHADGEIGDGADGGIAHCAFEGVIRIILLETGESVGEPLRGLGLVEEES